MAAAATRSPYAGGTTSEATLRGELTRLRAELDAEVGARQRLELLAKREVDLRVQAEARAREATERAAAQTKLAEAAELALRRPDPTRGGPATGKAHAPGSVGGSAAELAVLIAERAAQMALAGDPMGTAAVALAGAVWDLLRRRCEAALEAAAASGAVVRAASGSRRVSFDVVTEPITKVPKCPNDDEDGRKRHASLSLPPPIPPHCHFSLPHLTFTPRYATVKTFHAQPDAWAPTACSCWLILSLVPRRPFDRCAFLFEKRAALEDTKRFRAPSGWVSVGSFASAESSLPDLPGSPPPFPPVRGLFSRPRPVG